MSTTVLPHKTYGESSLAERFFSLSRFILKLPFILLYRLLTKDGSKPTKRVVVDTLGQCLSANVPYNVIQGLLGTTEDIYRAWAADNALIEDIGENVKLMWLGAKRVDRVVLYVHGGGYMIPGIDMGIKFWDYAKKEATTKSGVEFGMAVVAYSLVPAAVYPTQLAQLVHTIEHFIKLGTPPSQISLAGDSAGGNLVLQFLAHSLHPIAGVPTIPSSTTFGGIYLMSPWVDLAGTTFSSRMGYADGDLLLPATLQDWGLKVLADVPEEQRSYVQQIDLPEGFYQDLRQDIVFSYGGREGLKESIQLFYDRHFARNAKLLVDANGIHTDPFVNFGPLGSSPQGQLTSDIIDWLAKVTRN